MPTTITFFPVDNGDMTLIKFGDLDATTLLIDVNIRQDADDPDGDARDVAKDLRDRLKKDENGRPYVDAFLLSHPDQDHCRGLTRHFHLGPLDKYLDDNKDDKDKKIVIREMWSSPIVFRDGGPRFQPPPLTHDQEPFDRAAMAGLTKSNRCCPRKEGGALYFPSWQLRGSPLPNPRMNQCRRLATSPWMSGSPAASAAGTPSSRSPGSSNPRFCTKWVHTPA